MLGCTTVRSQGCAAPALRELGAEHFAAAGAGPVGPRNALRLEGPTAARQAAPEEERRPESNKAQSALQQLVDARGADLRTIVLEEVMLDVMYDIPSRDDVREVVVTRESVNETVPPLLVLHPETKKKEA